MPEIKKVSSEEIIFKGKLIEIVQQKFEVSGKSALFEWARRPPGTRMILDDKDLKKILLINEYRNELESNDFRLPGGKVYDSLDEYSNAKEGGNLLENEALQAIIRETKEETGLIPHNPQLIKVSKCGATVEWDLHYFYATKWAVGKGQELGLGEFISTLWVSYNDATKLCIDGTISEDRTRGVLLSYLLGKNLP